MLDVQNIKTLLLKDILQIGQKKFFAFNKIKNKVPWTCAISDLNGEETTGSFYEKELQKTSQKEFRTEKLITRKCDKLYVKWKGYDNRLYSCINKKDLVTSNV